MQFDAIKIAKEVVKKKMSARAISDKFEEKYGKGWNCVVYPLIVSRGAGTMSMQIYPKSDYIKFTMGDFQIFLYKSPQPDHI